VNIKFIPLQATILRVKIELSDLVIALGSRTFGHG
jgi:hypothetical protein